MDSTMTPPEFPTDLGGRLTYLLRSAVSAELTGGGKDNGSIRVQR
jgi:hypothetical protein